jgi:hypothetical protein
LFCQEVMEHEKWRPKVPGELWCQYANLLDHKHFNRLYGRPYDLYQSGAALRRRDIDYSNNCSTVSNYEELTRAKIPGSASITAVKHFMAFVRTATAVSQSTFKI